MKVLYEVLVPTKFGDTLSPIKTRHHKQWDKFVQNITRGLTILKPALGRWTHEGKEYPERVIPVRIMCEEQEFLETKPLGNNIFAKSVREHNQIDKIIQFTLKHYRQKAVFYYVVSEKVEIAYS